MSLYCIYLTIYLGDKLPPFYIGSTSTDKIKKGYHGSVTSVKYKHIWDNELKTNNHLFKTFVIPTPPILSQKHKLQLESLWQKAFDVVRSEDFINKCIATQDLFCADRESIEKAKITRAHTFAQNKSALKISESRKGLKLWNNGSIQTWSKQCPGEDWVLGATAETKMKNSQSQKKRNPITDETRQKLSARVKGKPLSEEHKNKIRQAMSGVKKSAETRAKMSQNMKGRRAWNKGQTFDSSSSNAQSCIVVSPSGDRYTYPSMRKACLAHNLSTAVMCDVKNGKKDNYKGWRVDR